MAIRSRRRPDAAHPDTVHDQRGAFAEALPGLLIDGKRGDASVPIRRGWALAAAATR